jgi:hypothetical protein
MRIGIVLVPLIPFVPTADFFLFLFKNELN